MAALPVWPRCVACGAHFVVRLTQGLHRQVVTRRPVPVGPHGGVHLRGDQTMRLAGWPDVEVRVVSYQLPDYRWVFVLTDRFDWTASSVARLSKERRKIEHGWKCSRPCSKSAPLGAEYQRLAAPTHFIAAFVTDLLWRVFKALGPFPPSLYEFVTRCQELSSVRLANIADGALHRAPEPIYAHLLHFPLPFRLPVCW